MSLRWSTAGKAALALGIVLVTLAIGFVRVHFDGDGQEYWLTTVALARHGSPEMRPGDIEAVLALPKPLLDTSGIALTWLRDVPSQLDGGAVLSYGFAHGRSGVLAIHFWLYSALAVLPWMAVSALGWPPATAFVIVNLACLLGGMAVLRRWYPAARWAGPLALLLLGGLFYLRWTGPEVFTACLVTVGSAAILRGRPGVALLCAGAAATQNPSAALLFGAAATSLLLARLVPAVGAHARATLPAPEICEGSQESWTRTLLLATAGALLIAAPYAFNQYQFGTTSIIARYYTDPHLIAPDRLLSILLDLNQGLLIGLPGLFAGLAALLCLTRRRALLAWRLLLAGSVTIALLLPALSATNWNSGLQVLMRYGYWAAMPLCAILLAHLGDLSPRQRTVLIAIIATLQLAAAWQARFLRGGHYLRHTMAAEWMLDHAPGVYNPVPEIFYERETHTERQLVPDDYAVHRTAAGVVKVLRHRASQHADIALCGPARRLQGTPVDAGHGWLYLNGPVQCVGR